MGFAKLEEARWGSTFMPPYVSISFEKSVLLATKHCWFSAFALRFTYWELRSFSFPYQLIHFLGFKSKPCPEDSEQKQFQSHLLFSFPLHPHIFFPRYRTMGTTKCENTAVKTVSLAKKYIFWLKGGVR